MQEQGTREIHVRTLSDIDEVTDYILCAYRAQDRTSDEMELRVIVHKHKRKEVIQI